MAKEVAQAARRLLGESDAYADLWQAGQICCITKLGSRTAACCRPVCTTCGALRRGTNRQHRAADAHLVAGSLTY